jgi:membrane-associated phospholipid phosphatase
MNDAISSWRVLLALVGAAALVPLSILFLDRPIASWSHDHLHGIVEFHWLTWIVDPLVPAAIAILAAAGLAALFGWRPGRWSRLAIACCIAALVAVTIKESLKYGFGRTWPETWTNGNPSWIGNGTYGFWPFHGGQGWASFPSGHMTLISAPIAVLWLELKRLRIVWAGLVALVAIGLFGSDYHFLGDMIAGTYLGAACGVSVAALMIRR